MAAESISILPSIVSGVFGFVGVLAGLGWNALQTPRTERRLRENTRTVLRTSLKAELTSLANLMRSEIAYVERNDFTWIPLVDSFKVYIANIQNLGLLTPIEVQKITEAYYQYQESAGYVARIAKDQPDKPAIGRHIEFDFTKAEAHTRNDLINTLTDIVTKADEAIRELESQLSAQPLQAARR
ncbi:hypothetical protein I6F21_26745 [Bradyrhizobium sp. NBAIM03]|uniref:hypothetical protein n=1 Tax=unclassified Bradyrhizobium TaxID=2631580 RepID=UPI001CD449DA|nr:MULTISPECIES: hypothetical protein [unclassified Bradyrhizobium]MCA1471218.1 hypothetical protein [Bradyrhizobium sp. IC3195]MCA1536134.1 hypothetical protein [Bradyrhizobium sp. NBAIM03]